jgi:hypothetical protein
VRYTVYRGDRGLEIGRATQQWEIAEGRYRLSSVMETTGLAALLRPLRVETQSEGSLGPQGFRPEEYQQKNSKSGEENINFNWEAGQLETSRHPPQALMPGSQDLLSLTYQFAYMVYPLSVAIGPKNSVSFWVATGKKYELYHFDIQGSESLELPAGQFYTLHLQAVGSTQTDLWLALDYLMLPVKIRFTDKDGDIYEQAAREIIIRLPEENAPSAPPTPSPLPLEP